MSHCEACVVSLTLLVGMGLSDMVTPPESLETEGQVGHMLCALVTTLPPLLPGQGGRLLCQLWVYVLGSALLSVSRLNCHPGNF